MYIFPSICSSRFIIKFIVKQLKIAIRQKREEEWSTFSQSATNDTGTMSQAYAEAQLHINALNNRVRALEAENKRLRELTQKEATDRRNTEKIQSVVAVLDEKQVEMTFPNPIVETTEE